jgi:UDPglucose 6-dehydrogenase
MSSSTYHIVYAGLGVVGIGYLKAFESMGFKVTGIEANRKLIDELKVERPVYHVDDDMNDIKDVDFVLLSINTPLRGKKLDLTYLFSSIKNVAVIVKNNPNALVVIRSTVPAGTTRKYKDELEAVSGQKVAVLFQPEFLRDKTNIQDAMNPWHVVIGHDGEDVSKFREMYTYFIENESITEMSVDEAENMKLFHNSFNAAKISYFNQCKMLVQEMNKKNGTTMNIDVITETMTKTCEGLMNARYGTKAGHGYYGSCLPKDSAELASLEEEFGLESKLFREVVVVNNIMVSTDTEVVLHGDHHMEHQTMKKISSNDLLSKA